MTFLAPFLLWMLPLAAMPVIVHLIHLYRRRQVKWAAMMFLRAAQRMNKGLSRLRQVLILLFRVLAVAAIIFVVTRPLAGGWLGLTGGAPDTVLVLLDRSASMEQLNLNTGISKRQAAVRKVADAIEQAVGTKSHLVLIDSALGQPLPLERAKALLDVPQTGPTDTAADIPGLLQRALDYVTTNKTGRTDVWLLSDLQRTDWDAAGGRWAPLRSGFSSLQGVRFHILTYPQPATDDLAITVENVSRRETSEKAELLLDIRVTRQAVNPQPMEVPIRLEVNGAATTIKGQMKENQLVLQAYAVPIDKATKRGWGRVELPADASPENNVFNFVFDEPAVLRSVIVAEDEAEAAPLQAALSAPADPTRKYLSTVLPVARAAEIPWEETALLIWQAPLPKADDAVARQIQELVTAGRTVMFLPPENPDETRMFGLGWTQWTGEAGAKGAAMDWWRNDADLLANTRDGVALPVGTLEVARRCGIAGEGIPLARVGPQDALVMRAALGQGGGVYFLGTLPSTQYSSLARDGVVMFVAVQRALTDGARTLGKAQQREAGANALGADAAKWQPVAEKGKEKEASFTTERPLRAGVLASGEQQVALNRPPGEDSPERLSEEAVKELFAGTDFRILTDTLEDARGLTNEIWRTFLMAMAAALVGEALLCMPPRRTAAPENMSKRHAAAFETV